MVNERWLVVGGGIKGMVAASLLSERGQDVVLVEESEGLGGVLRSVEWNGYVLDKGCHLFGNIDHEATRILRELARDKVVPVDVRYASVTNGIKTDGFAIPDITVLPEPEALQALGVLLYAAAQVQEAPSHLGERLEQRFGPRAAEILSICVEKMYQIHPSSLEPGFLEETPFNRVRVANEDVTTLLKQVPELDDRIAGSPAQDPFRFYPEARKAYPHRNFYPAKDGLLGFCRSAESKLRADGVVLATDWAPAKIQLSTNRVTIESTQGDELEGDRMFWAAGLSSLAKALGVANRLEALTHRVPMVVYYFTLEEAQVGPYTYVHDFDPSHLVFRASAPGSYGPLTAPDGLSYLCCEVPTRTDTDLWNQPEEFKDRVWSEVRDLEVAQADSPIDTLAVPVTETYSAPLQGFHREFQRVLSCLPKYDSLVVPRELAFSKVDIIHLVKDAIQEE